MTERDASQHVAINCPQCGKTLRVPCDRGTLSVSCPACSHRFQWSPGRAQSEPGVSTNDADYLQLAARLVTGTLLGEMKRADGPGGAVQGSVDPERIAGTSFLAGRKVFGDAYTRALVEDAVRWGGEDVRNCLDRLAGEPMFAHIKAGCSAEEKDALILAALTALELNIDDIGVEMLKLRAFAHRLYDTPVEGDRRMILYGEAGASLYPRAIALVNEIVRELNGGATPAPEAAAVSGKEAKPARKIGKGLSILIACALFSLATIKFGAQNVEGPPAWLALGGIAISIFFYYWVYRGFRLMTGAGKWTSVALTIFGFPVLFGGMLFLAGLAMPYLDHGGDVFADFGPGGDAGPQDIGNGDYFSGLNANNTSTAEMDQLMEDW